MKKLIIAAFAIAAIVTGQKLSLKPKCRRRAMYPTKDIIDNAVNSKDHTTLVAAVKAAGLVETLKGAGPFHCVLPQPTRHLNNYLPER